MANLGKALKWTLLLAISLGVTSLTATAQGRSGEHGRGWAKGHSKHFNDHDRQEVRYWENEHRGHMPKGLRMQDRLDPEMEEQLRVGVVLTPALRQRIEPVPASLVVLLEPAPPRYRYVAVGDHICLVDAGFNVADILHLELNF